MASSNLNSVKFKSFTISVASMCLLLCILIGIFDINTVAAGKSSYHDRLKFPKFAKFPIFQKIESDPVEPYSADPSTSIEKPPMSTRNLKPRPSGVDDAGITILYGKPTATPKTITVQPKDKSSLVKFHDLVGRGVVKVLKHFGLKDISTALSFNGILNGLMGTKSGDGVSTGRHGSGFMDGAMVPMSFLLMAAFIMDILQRLFPLPYATFVHQAQHRYPPPLPAPSDKVTTMMPMMPAASNLDKFQINTPIGSVGVETNENYHEKFHDLMGL